MMDEDASRRAVVYLERVNGVLDALVDYVDNDILSEARRMVGFGEAPIGLGIVAFWMVESGKAFPRAFLEEILFLTDGVSEPGIDLPLNLLDYSD